MMYQPKNPRYSSRIGMTTQLKIDEFYSNLRSNIKKIGHKTRIAIGGVLFISLLGLYASSCVEDVKTFLQSRDGTEFNGNARPNSLDSLLEH